MNSQHDISSDDSDILARAERLLADGHCLEAIELVRLEIGNSVRPDLEVELVSLRHRGFVRSDREIEDSGWPQKVPDMFPEVSGLPEVTAGELSSDAIASAFEHHGSLIVRELFDADCVERLLPEIMKAIECSDAVAGGSPSDSFGPIYVPFEAADEYEFGSLERAVAQRVGGVLSVEAPRAFNLVIQAFHERGIGPLLTEYLGEWPVLSAKKSTMRRATPQAPTEWHQDGSFLGPSLRTVNIWTALTDCGVDAPGLDVVARPLAEIVATGTDDALFDWSVSTRQADLVAGDNVVRPEFHSGDALFFNQLTLHRSAVDPSMTSDRYAIESWFFTPSTYPYEQIPILF